MAKLKNTITATVKVEGEDVMFMLRKPTNEELNNFLAKRYEVSGRKGNVKDHSMQARVDFFDTLLTKVENLEDDAGAVTSERKDAIPANWKSEIIFKSFEDVEIDVKN